MHGELYSNLSKDDPSGQLVWTDATPQQVLWQNIGDLSNVQSDGTVFYSFFSGSWEVMAEASMTLFAGQKAQIRLYFSDNTGIPFPGSDAVITTFGGHGSVRFNKTMQSGSNTPVSVWAVPVSATYPLTVSFYQGSFIVREIGIIPG